MHKAKYIVLGGAIERMIIFPCAMTHAEVATRLDDTVVSAGFMTVGMHDGRIRALCYGHSASLRCKTRPELDTALATHMLDL